MLLAGCSTRLQVNVVAGSTFASLTPATVRSNGTLSSTGFNQGTAGSAVLVQAAYTRPYDVQWLAARFGATPTQLSTVAILTEPSSS